MQPQRKSRAKPDSRRSIAALRKLERIARKAEKISQANARKAERALKRENALAAAAAEAKAAEARRTAANAKRKAKRDAAEAKRVAALPEPLKAVEALRVEASRTYWRARQASGYPQPIWGSHKAAREHNAALFESAGWRARIEAIIAYCAAGLKFDDACRIVFIVPLTAGKWLSQRPMFNEQLCCANPYIEHLKETGFYEAADIATKIKTRVHGSGWGRGKHAGKKRREAKKQKQLDREYLA